MQRRFPILVLAVLPLLFAACENKTAAPPASAPPTPAESTAAPKPAGPTMTVAFELDGAAPIGALQIDIAYVGEGRFVGDADAVACETKIDGALSSYNHIVDQKTLRAAFVAVKGFAGPIRLGECKFQGAAKAGDFTVTVRDSSSPELSPVDPPPVIKVVLG